MQSGHFLPKCDVVVVGADSIFLDGTFINKTGTFVLAVLAKTLDRPFYVVSETDKITHHTFIDGNVDLEEKVADEVFNGRVDFTIRNIYFDITPSMYITRFITEKGIFKPGELEGVFKPIK
jgi:translation initiation factor 2B subunit (eIF-2B alpha/beta/delta family)